MKGGGLRRDIGMLFSNISSPRWRSSEIRIVGKETVKMGVQFSSVRSLRRVRLFATPWIAARQAFLSITNSQSLLNLMSIKSVMPSSHLILCCPLLLPPVPPSIRLFSNESTLRIGGHVKLQSIGVSASASSKWKQIQWNRIAELTYDIKNNNEISGKHRSIIHRIDVTLI